MNLSNCSLAVLLKYGRGRITSPIAHLLITPLAAQFIVSFPRSGSTWLRTMLTSVLYPDFDGDPKVFNRVIPGSTLTRLRHVYKSPSPHRLSTHATYHGGVRRAVYLIRNGRNSVPSFYRYTTTRAGIHRDFKKWFTCYAKGFYGPRWDQHVVSWLIKGRNHMKEDLLIVKYEDFLTSPATQLRQVCEFLGISCTERDLARAVEIAGLSNMRKWERYYNGEIEDPNASFYRGGKAEEWENLFDVAQKKKFFEMSEKALQLGGYI